MKNCGKFEDNLNVIGPILKEKRMEKHISLEKLSAKLLLLGVNNKRTVRDYEICAIAIALKIDVSELLNPIIHQFHAS